MSQNEPSTPSTTQRRGFVQFWTTLPGLLTAVATLLTALTAIGVFKATTNDQSAAAAGATSTATATTAGGTPPKRVTPPKRRITPPPGSAETGRTRDANAPAVEVLVRADPFSGSAACPVEIRFLARISVTDLGGAGPIQLAYRWVRSDGASAPVETVTFERPGSQDIETTWTRGGPGDRVDGWQQLEITSPVQARSERAAFDVTC